MRRVAVETDSVSATTWTSSTLTSKVTLLSGLAGADRRRLRTASDRSFVHDRVVAWLGFLWGGQRPSEHAAGIHMSIETETRTLEVPLGRLEWSLIDEFVRARGYDPNQLVDLSEDDREKLLADACIYASMKLVEVEARSHFLDKIHDGTPRIPNGLD
jgi:hypothetical protein